MTARVVLACDGVWHGDRCRQAIPVGEVVTGTQARHIAATAGGWTAWLRQTGTPEDLCPACTRRRAENPIPRQVSWRHAGVS